MVPPTKTPNTIPEPSRATIRDAVTRALSEDLTGAGDLTSQAVIPRNATLTAVIAARTPGTLCGTALAIETCAQIDERITVTPLVCDAAAVDKNTAIAQMSGPAHSIMTAERTALNFMTHLSGIATLTREFVSQIEGSGAKIVGTRKTTPGLRALETYAIRCGGGANHRYNLSDAILIKDNHIAAAGGVPAAMTAARTNAGHMTHISIEVDTLEQLHQALQHCPDVILLDNFSIPDMTEAVEFAHGKCVLEASGGVNLNTVQAIAQTGVDVISVGALTHSAPALDLGLDVLSDTAAEGKARVRTHSE